MAAQILLAATAPVRVLVAETVVRLLAPASGHASVGLSIVLFGLVLAAARYAQIRSREDGRLLGELVGRAVLDRLLAAVDEFELMSFEDAAFHDELRRVRDSQARCIQGIAALVATFGAVLGTLGTLLALSSMQLLLLPLALIALVPTIFTARRNARAEYDFVVNATASDRQRFYVESLLLERAGAEEVRAFQLGPHLRKIHSDLCDIRMGQLRALVNDRMRRSLVMSAVNLVTSASLAGVLIWLYVSRGVPLASAAAGSYGLVILTGQLGVAARAGDTLHGAMLFINDLNAFFPRASPRKTSNLQADNAERFEGVALDEVSFTYPGSHRRALSDVSLRIDPGELVAIVGPNGSGKTTAAKIVAGLYQAQSGRVTWGGVETSGLDPCLLHDRVGICFQDFQRLRLSVGDNIAVGRYERRDNREEISLAAASSRADEFIVRLPEGYATQLGPEVAGGHDLSEGQWQRLAVARVFFRDAQLVILDEPTAALDPLAEFELFETLRAATRDRAALVISHRLATVRSADRIYVMNQGRVAESGTHDHLIALGGLYAHLFELQARPFVSVDDPVRSSL
jgi:ATP-binding cassette subfamily B protein